jgi:hypothetical protein
VKLSLDLIMIGEQTGDDGNNGNLDAGGANIPISLPERIKLRLMK